MYKLSPIMKYIVASIIGSGIISFFLTYFKLDGKSLVHSLDYLMIGFGGLIFSFVLSVILVLFGERKSLFLLVSFLISSVSYPISLTVAFPLSIFSNMIISFFFIGNQLSLELGSVVGVGIVGICFIFLGLSFFKGYKIILEVIGAWLIFGILSTIIIGKFSLPLISIQFVWQSIVIFYILLLRKNYFIEKKR